MPKFNNLDYYSYHHIKEAFYRYEKLLPGNAKLEFRAVEDREIFGLRLETTDDFEELAFHLKNDEKLRPLEFISFIAGLNFIVIDSMEVPIGFLDIDEKLGQILSSVNRIEAEQISLKQEYFDSQEDLSPIVKAKSVSVYGNFVDAQFMPQFLQRIYEINPDLEAFHATSVYRLCDLNLSDVNFDNSIDLSYLTKFKNITSLHLPVAVISDFGFLDEMQIKEIRSTIPYIIYPTEDIRMSAKRHYLEGCDRLISKINDCKPELIETLDIQLYELDQENFEKICNKLDGLKFLSIKTSQISDFTSLEKMRNLEELIVTKLHLPEGVKLLNLKRLTLEISAEDDLTTTSFITTSDAFPNLIELDIKSRNNNTIDKSFIEKLRNLRNCTISENSGIYLFEFETTNQISSATASAFVELGQERIGSSRGL